MGCVLGCFGSSKDRKRQIQRNKKVQPRDQRKEIYQPVQSTVSLLQDNTEKPIISVTELRDKPEEQPSFSSRKKVTFDWNVKTYEPVSPYESKDFSPDTEEGGKKENVDNLAKSSQSQSSSEDSSTTSSLGSYPPNHRYRNCRDSDEEDRELDYEESDLDDDEDDSGQVYDDFDDDDDGRYMELRTSISAAEVVTEEVEIPMPICSFLDREVSSIVLNRNARDRSVYVHPVLNPVENLSQWKAVKAKGKPPLKPREENVTSDQEPQVSFQLEQSFKELSFSFKSKFDQPKKPNQEIAVDTSLSNWLVSSEATPINKISTGGFDTVTPEQSTLRGSNSLRCLDDRPILGALTVEELRQFSASSSPRRSPSRSLDEMPLIGTVGTYWSHSGPGNDSGSASSYKGIPNTTTKNREVQVK